jgi:hypothetical protein
MTGAEEMRSPLYGDEIGRLGVLEELDVLSSIGDGVDDVFCALLRMLVMGWANPSRLFPSPQQKTTEAEGDRK